MTLPDIIFSASKDQPSLLREFFAPFLPMLVLLASVVGGYFYVDFSDQLEASSARQVDHADLGFRAVSQALKEVTTDVRVLAASVSLQRFLESPSPQALADVSREFQSLSQHKGFYDQVRYLDEQGMEVVRVNFHNGNTTLVPAEALQNKGKRYYFLDAFRLRQGELFISPLDLNIERGAIELPYKPMVRVGTPVFDRKGVKRGVVLVNYLARNMLESLETAISNTEGQPFLLNAEGYWLLAGDPELEWGFMLGNEHTFSARFPEVWQHMLDSDSGQINVDDDTFTWRTVHPLAENTVSSTGSVEAFAASEMQIGGKSYFWKLGTHVPSLFVAQWRDERIRAGLPLFLLLSLLTAIGSLYLAQSRAQEKRTARNLRLNERRLRTITSELAEGLIALDSEGKLSMMNPEAERLLGWSEASLAGEDCHSLIHQIRHGPGRGDCPILDAGRRSQVVRVEEDSFLTKDGREIPVAYSAAPMIMDGKQVGVIVIFQDITERKEAMERLEHLATHDSLTGLFNRGESERRLAQSFQLAKRYDRPLSVCMLDIDYFKKVNDTYGHQAGDEVLRTMGGILRSMTREADCAGRFGGEEFLLILAETNLDGAARLGELLRQRIETSVIDIDGGEQVLTISASIGVTSYSENVPDPGTLIKMADEALYRAKQEGRNRVCAETRPVIDIV